MNLDFLIEDVVRFANDIVIVTEAQPLDEPGPKIVYVNEAFTKLTGYKFDEVLGKTPRILQGPESDPETKSDIRAALEKKEPIRTSIVNYSKSGTKYWLDINIIPLKNEKGEVTHFAAIERDLTEIKEKNKQLLELNEYDFSPYKCFSNMTEREPGRYTWGMDKFGVRVPLTLSMKMKNKFLGIASHDLRNPLYLIRSFSEILKDEDVGKLNDQQRELLEKIFNSSNYMRSLLENLLDISKIESGKLDLDLRV